MVRAALWDTVKQKVVSAFHAVNNHKYMQEL